MENQNQPETIFSRLARVQTALIATKNRKNDFGKYNYRSCEDILQAVKPLLTDNDLTLTLSDEIIEISGRFYIKATATIYSTDFGEESYSVTAYARESETKSGMDVAQITGSCSSYARKYALNGLFCIDDNKDIDSNEYAELTQEKPKRTTKKKTDSADSGVVPRGTIDELPDEITPPAVLCHKCGNEIKGNEKFTAEQIVNQSINAFGFPHCLTCGRELAAEIKAKKAQGDK